MTGQGSRCWRLPAVLLPAVRLPAVLLLAVLLLAVLLAACTGTDDGPSTVQPGAPGEPGQVLTDGVPQWTDQPHTAPDVAFMHAMLAHHAQALRMTGLVPDRTEREDLLLFAQRVELSQEAEIALMQDWLEARGEDDPAAGHGPHGGDTMPGMLTEAQFAELAAAIGPDFDRRFLELMIYHHEGALTMIADLLDSGGGQHGEVFALITHMDADQRIEIDRMNGLLAELDSG